MDLQEKRRKIASDIFVATGAKVDGYDPLVIAALFYSEHLRTAGDAVAVRLEAATKELVAASSIATAANGSLLADRAKLLKDIEAHVARCVKQASKGQASIQDFRYVPLHFALVGAVVAAVLTSAALVFALDRGSAQASEAAIGRAFSRVVPELDPKVREHIMEHLRKKAG